MDNVGLKLYRSSSPTEDVISKPYVLQCRILNGVPSHHISGSFPHSIREVFSVEKRLPKRSYFTLFAPETGFLDSGGEVRRIGVVLEGLGESGENILGLSMSSIQAEKRGKQIDATTEDRLGSKQMWSPFFRS
eukprot:jgi/Bigna1/126004/aug1.1_g712